MRYSHRQNISLIIFDFDGTIADTSEGILCAHKYALKTMGKAIPPDEELRGLIGLNLLDCYMSHFCLDYSGAVKAIKAYRAYYEENGIYQVTIYPGIERTVKVLKARGFQTAIATLKAERFAQKMLDSLGIQDCFNAVCGIITDDSVTKCELILKCIKECDCQRNEVILVGDSKNDAIGAQQAGVAFLGVTYGFGFKHNVPIEYPNIGMANTPEEIVQILNSK